MKIKLSASIMCANFSCLDSPILRVAAPNVPPPAVPVLEKVFMPDEKDIIEAVKKLV